MINVYQPVKDPLTTGSGHSISCSAAVPAGVDPEMVKIVWSKGSKVINPSSSQSSINVVDSYNASVVTKRVMFTQLRAADNGTYQCNVTVEGFSASSTAIIVVNGE